MTTTTPQISQDELVSMIIKAVTDASTTRIAGVTAETKLEDFKLDSLAAMEILMNVESELKSKTANKSISLPDTLLSQSPTVGDLASGVYKHLYGGA